MSGIGEPVVRQCSEEEHAGRRCEKLQRRIQRGDLEDDQQEADAVLDRADMAAGTHAPCDRYRDIGHRVGTAEEGHGAGGRVAEAIGQQVQELAEVM